MTDDENLDIYKNLEKNIIYNPNSNIYKNLEKMCDDIHKDCSYDKDRLLSLSPDMKEYYLHFYPDDFKLLRAEDLTEDIVMNIIMSSGGQYYRELLNMAEGNEEIMKFLVSEKVLKTAIKLYPANCQNLDGHLNDDIILDLLKSITNDNYRYTEIQKQSLISYLLKSGFPASYRIGDNVVEYIITEYHDNKTNIIPNLFSRMTLEQVANLPSELTLLIEFDESDDGDY